MLQHVAIEVTDAVAGAEAAFFALLGFAEVAPPTGLAGTSRWLQRGGDQVHLLLTDEQVVPPGGHLAVVAPAYAVTLARLAPAGFAPDPRAEHWGAPRAFVRSPGGHRVELMAAPPPA